MYLYHNSHRRSRFEFYDEVIIEHDDLCDQPPNEHFVKFRDGRELCSYEIPEGADLLAMFIVNRGINAGLIPYLAQPQDLGSNGIIIIVITAIPFVFSDQVDGY